MVVLDASALFAYLKDESGAEVVEEAIADDPVISAVNLAEVMAKLPVPKDFVSALTVEPFTLEDAVEVARLYPQTRSAGLGIGDRACIALARRLNVEGLTSDQSWSSVLDVLDVNVRFIR